RLARRSDRFASPCFRWGCPRPTHGGSCLAWARQTCPVPARPGKSARPAIQSEGEHAARQTLLGQAVQYLPLVLLILTLVDNPTPHRGQSAVSLPLHSLSGDFLLLCQSPQHLAHRLMLRFDLLKQCREFFLVVFRERCQRIVSRKQKVRFGVVHIENQRGPVEV